MPTAHRKATIGPKESAAAILTVTLVSAISSLRRDQGLTIFLLRRYTWILPRSMGESDQRHPSTIVCNVPHPLKISAQMINIVGAGPAA
jgi:hypothetical protein